MIPEGFLIEKLAPALGGLFGGDGHTCCLDMLEGKRDLLSSISFSKSRTEEYKDSLVTMMNDIKQLLSRFNIHKVTIQNFKQLYNNLTNKIKTSH
jgi:hypothetical protein